MGAVAGGLAVAIALLEDYRRGEDATTSKRDDDDATWASAYVSKLLSFCRRRNTNNTTAAAAYGTKMAITHHHFPPPLMPDILSSIGNTPMMRVASLSAATGCDILIKCEFANPGGSVKDRVALRIIQEALLSGELVPGGVVTEGTAGSTGVSLAMVAGALGCKAYLALPDDAALEKSQLMAAYGATVQRVRPVSITHREHFVNVVGS